MKLFFTGIFIIGCCALPAFSTTTAPSKNTSTTAAPPTTHIATTITPTPSTNAAYNSYNYTKADNTTCLMVNMTVYFVAPTGIINVTQNATVDVDNSSCSTLVVLFGKENSFQLTFNQTTDNTSFFLAEVDVTLNGVSASNASDLLDCKIAMKSSYKSDNGFNVTLEKITMVTTHVQLQAFEVDKNQFGAAVDCSDLSAIIPIVVGAVLGVLVLIVIIAYLIGRRRSRSGYEAI